MNFNCNRNIIDISGYGNLLNIDYTSVVKMKDVTGLDKVIFSDEFFFKEISEREKLIKSRSKAKMVTYSEKFKNTCVDDDFSADKTDTSFLRGNGNRKTGIKIKEN